MKCVIIIRQYNFTGKNLLYFQKLTSVTVTASHRVKTKNTSMNFNWETKFCFCAVMTVNCFLGGSQRSTYLYHSLNSGHHFKALNRSKIFLQLNVPVFQNVGLFSELSSDLLKSY